MARKRSLQMCVYPKISCTIQFLNHPCRVFFPPLSGVDLLTQMTVHGSSGLQPSSGRSHDCIHIDPIVDPVCYLVDMLIKFIYNHLGDNNNHAPAMGRFVDMIYALVSMTEPIRGHHAVQLCEV